MIGSRFGGAGRLMPEGAICGVAPPEVDEGAALVPVAPNEDLHWAIPSPGKGAGEGDVAKFARVYALAEEE
jgi:hypothetical protein